MLSGFKWNLHWSLPQQFRFVLLYPVSQQGALDSFPPASESFGNIPFEKDQFRELASLLRGQTPPPQLRRGPPEDVFAGDARKGAGYDAVNQRALSNTLKHSLPSGLEAEHVPHFGHQLVQKDTLTKTFLLNRSQMLKEVHLPDFIERLYTGLEFLIGDSENVLQVVRWLLGRCLLKDIHQFFKQM